MPCRSDYYDEPREEHSLTPLLCEAIDIIESLQATSGLDVKMSKQLRAWAKRHQESEVTRVRREAMAKLTPREKRALGLKDK